MSIIDNSVQLNTSNINVGIISSNILLPYLTISTASNIFVTSNVLINAFLPTKQNILTSSTVLLGNGGSITGIDYNNITVNAPNLSVYDTITARNTVLGNYLTTATASSTYATITNLGTKENALTFSAPLTRTTNTISLDLSTYDTISARNTAINNQNTINSNYFVSSNVSTNIFNNLITPYDTIALRNTALGSYTTTSALTTLLSAKENTLTFSAPLTRTTNTISLDLSTYDTIALRNTALGSYTTTSALTTLLSAKEATLTFNAPLTRTTNTISLDLSTYDTIALRNTALSSYLPLSGGTLTGNIIISTANSGIILVNGSGAAFGEASGAGAYSSSAAVGDAIVRSKTSSQLLLQSGSGAAAIAISSANNTTINNTLNVNGVANFNYPDIRINAVNGVSLLTLEARIMGTNGYSACFGGDMYETSYWGKVVCINGGGLGDNVNAGAAKIPNTSSFSIYTRSSGSSTYFDKNLFVVRNSGNVGIGTTNPQYLLDVNGSANINGVLTILKDNWILSSDGILRIFFQNNGTTYFHSGNTGSEGFKFRNFAQSVDLLTITDAGNITSAGSLTTSGAIYANGNSLIFPNTLSDLKITLFSGWGFGIQSGELKYIGGGNHKFYNSTTNTFSIDGSGNINSLGAITTSSGNSYLNGLRINGGDTGNTIYQATGDLGITTNTTNINLGMNTYGVKINITPTSTTLYTNTTISATTPSLNIIGSSEADSAILYLATPYTSGSALKCAIIAQGQTTFSRSKLHFCLDNTADNTYPTYNASVANSRMSIDYNGNVFLTNSLNFKTDVWNYSTEGYQRLFFGNAGITYYQGYGQYVLDINHEWRNHQGVQKMRLDNSGNLKLAGALQCNFLTIANTNRDLTGIAIENTAVNDFNNTVLYCIQGTFTGFHRVFTDDELYNNDNPQQFKDDYEGRIVVSNGKTATDTTDNGVQDNTVWEILYDKAGITIEDALPKIELSRNKKDKRVFGVLGDKRRHNNRPERMIVNSVGEGGIWVCNSNGNIENGDYITSSNYLGYGERQDDDLLHNYTVAKATINCNFELDSQYYKCLEIDDLDENGNKLRVAFIAVTYHCG